jgi:hypothetical protein
LTWINDNDEDLACKELSIQDESRFRKWSVPCLWPRE